MIIYPPMLRGGKNQSIFVELLSTTNTPFIGKIASDMTANLVRVKLAPLSAPLVQLASIGSTYTNRGFIEVDAVKCPGLYRLDLPDVLFVNDGVSLVLTVSLVAVGMSPLNIIIPLIDQNLSAATIS